MFCDRCGDHNEDHAKFCGSCGAPLDSAMEGDPQPAKKLDDEAYYSTTANQPYQQPTYNPQYHQAPPVFQPPPYAMMPVAVIPNTRDYKFWALAPFFITLFFVLLILALFSTNYLLFEFLFDIFFLSFPLFFLGLFAGTFIYMYYTYLNFKDFEDLTLSTHGYVSDMQSPGIMILLLFVFPPLTYYYKYNQLHEHLRLFHGEFLSLPPSGAQIIVLQLVFFVGAPVFLPILIFVFFEVWWLLLLLIILPFIIFFTFENRWQNAMNTHIMNHRR
jgi:hypothetical protein